MKNMIKSSQNKQTNKKTQLTNKINAIALYTIIV